MTDWKKIGVITVDAGICWVGDPCYILHKKPEQMPDAVGKSWSGFCSRLLDRHPDPSPTHQFDHSPGHPGLGVVVSTGYGDGEYDVEARFTSEGRVAEVRVVFISEEDEAL